MFLRRYQILYSEGDYQSHIYLPLYGTLRLWNKERGIICSNLCMGMSVGEEALNDPMYVARSENCFAEQDAAVLCIERDNWVLNRERMMYEALQRRSPKRSGQDQVTKDINLLDEIFRFNYYNKKR
jgi:CRP-like cAMP-binding protein